ALGQLTRHPRPADADEVEQLAPADVEAVTDLGVEIHAPLAQGGGVRAAHSSYRGRHGRVKRIRRRSLAFSARPGTLKDARVGTEGGASMRRNLWLSVAVVGMALLAAPAGRAADDEAIQKAIDRGVAALKDMQRPNGTWPYDEIGATALAGLTLV